MSEISSVWNTIDKNKARRREFEVMMESTLVDFQHKIHELILLIEHWLNDADICIIITYVHLKINLPFVNKYPLPTVFFEYEGKKVNIIPKYIFIAGGAKGIVNLICGLPQPKCFTLFMEVPCREHEGWIICCEDKRSIDGSVLTKSEFFSALDM